MLLLYLFSECGQNISFFLVSLDKITTETKNFTEKNNFSEWCKFLYRFTHKDWDVYDALKTLRYDFLTVKK